MSAALRQRTPTRPRPAAGQPGFATLRLEDFSSRILTAHAIVPGPEALAQAREDGRREGEAAAEARQMAALVAALRDHAQASADADMQRERQDQALRDEFAELLRAVAGCLLPLGQDGRLIEALVAAVTDHPPAQPARITIGCPPHLHAALRTACRDAGRPEPAIEAAEGAFVQVDNETTRIDLAAVQDRVLRLIKDYPAGEN